MSKQLDRQTFSNVEISHVLLWTTHHNLCNSNHYSILIRIPSATQNKATQRRPQKWRIHKADWSSFTSLCGTLYNDPPDADINTLVASFNHHIIEAENQIIPRTSCHIKTRNVPWWNNELKTAIKQRNTTLKKFYTIASPADLTLFRLWRTQARPTTTMQ